MQAMSEQARIVRLPMNRVSALNKISKTYAVLEQQFQREPSLAELSETLSLSEEQVSMDIGSNGRHISLDAPFIYNEESSLGDILPNNNEQTTDFSLLNDSLKDDIRRALAILSPREVEVVSYYFGLNDIPSQTLEEIGSILNLTRERVRQIKQKAIFRLKGKLYNSYINEGYLV
jgi:RNA polymerase primary sigma factor